MATLKNPPPYMATAEAISDCEVLAWNHSVIRKLVSLHPMLGENALHIALGYLRTHMARHVGLVTKTAEERLAETLFRLSDQCGQFHPDGIEIRATNDELSALADISPFTTSRVLRNWRFQGTLRKDAVGSFCMRSRRAHESLKEKPCARKKARRSPELGLPTECGAMRKTVEL